MVGIDNPKLEEIQVVSLMDSHPGDAARVARLKLEGDVAIASNEQALLGESQDATIEGLGDDRMARELHRELDCNRKQLLRLEPELLKARIVLGWLEDRLIPIINRRRQSARSLGFQPVTVLRANRGDKEKQTGRHGDHGYSKRNVFHRFFVLV